MHIVLQNPVTITRFYQPGLPNAVFCLKPALISHILLFPAYSLQCFLSKRLFPAKRALRPGMIFASLASRDELAGLASADDLRRIATFAMVCPVLRNRALLSSPRVFSDERLFCHPFSLHQNLLTGEQPFAPTKESHNRLTLSSRNDPARDLVLLLPCSSSE